MASQSVPFLNINASQISNPSRVKDLLNLILTQNVLFVTIQEINVFSARKVFRNDFQVFVNNDLKRADNIGIVTLVRKDIKVLDQILSVDGRILGIKCSTLQLWNIYPLSGTENKTKRETFFRETLCNLMMNWKDHTKFVFQAGDHNCIFRKQDSLNNPEQHIQQGLIAHLRVHGLKDGFIQVHGESKIEYSRETNRSATRIDFIFSNSNDCFFFKYFDTQLGYDHKAVIGIYNIDLQKSVEFIPRERFFQSWAIPRFLEMDKTFLDAIKQIFDDIWLECLNSEDYCIDHFWAKTKFLIQSLAKSREKEIYFEENNRLNVLFAYYSGALLRLEEGFDCNQELKDIKKEINEIQNNRSKKLLDKMRGLEIQDHVYDIHKLQKEKKYENQKKITEIKIGENTFVGTKNVLEGIQNKIAEEVKVFGDLNRDDPPTEEEMYFLNLIPEVEWTEEDIDKLTGPTTEEEISKILNFEVDLDSSPGEDGITFRFIKIFWSSESYRKLYLTYLNKTRSEGNMGCVENLGIMVVKNKKSHSIEYDKKRKLTKVNKDSNMGNGKVWTNRMKDIVLPKILPKTQFNCQKDINIIDEIREIRSVNQFLINEGAKDQIDGTILSIDFNNAYRSTSLRWFNLVMKKFNLPQEFIDWFWMMYCDLGIMIVINKYKSNILKVERGFMEGHPPSMAAFVVAIIPLLKALEGNLVGITTLDGKNHKLKSFADDLKLFLKNLNEIDACFKSICKFEKVSGLKMHRDPKREKCQALPFGKHRQFNNWPDWITVKDAIKVVGVWFGNREADFETLNSKLVAQNFYNALQSWLGTRGTIFQKVYIVNTFLFSKLWYLAQVVKLDEKVLKTLLAKALSFIYGEENERPVRVLNFRDVKRGGLGLINPIIKGRALMLKSMYKDFKSNCCRGDGGNDYDDNDDDEDNDKIGKMYGHRKDFLELYQNFLSNATAKSIYEKLMEKVCFRNGSLIPSRNEKRVACIKWSLTWKNFKLLKGINAEEKVFIWKVIQDMLPIGRRIHRKNAEKRCLIELYDGSKCLVIPDLKHSLIQCEGVKNSFEEVKRIIELFLEKKIDSSQLIFLAFNHRNKRKLKLACWFVVKCLYLMHNEKLFNKTQLLAEIRRSLKWNIELMKNSCFSWDTELSANLLNMLR